MSQSRAKGTKAESDIVAYLNANGFPYAERRALAGINDRGDIAGVPGWCIEIKSCKQASPGAWLREAEVEARNAGVALFCTWVKKAGTTDPGKWTVTMPAHVYVAAATCSRVVEPPYAVSPVVMSGAAFVEMIGEQSGGEFVGGTYL